MAMDHDIDTQVRELEAGPDGPVVAAWRWLELAADGDHLDEVWKRTDGDLRLDLANAVVWENGCVAEVLVETGLDRWPAFWRAKLLARVWGIAKGYDEATWRACSLPRPVGLDLEAVVFVASPEVERLTGVEQLTEDTPADLVLVMRRVPGAWLVAGFQRNAR